MQICLRPLEPRDLGLLLQLELDPENRQFSRDPEDLNREQLEAFLASDHDLKRYGQYRWVAMCADDAIGFVDVYDADPETQTLWVGILISREMRGKGMGKKALEALHRLLPALGYCTVKAEVFSFNQAAHHFFNQCGYNLESKKTDAAIYVYRLDCVIL